MHAPEYQARVLDDLLGALALKPKRRPQFAREDRYTIDLDEPHGWSIDVKFRWHQEIGDEPAVQITEVLLETGRNTYCVKLEDVARELDLWESMIADEIETRNEAHARYLREGA